VLSAECWEKRRISWQSAVGKGERELAVGSGQGGKRVGGGQLAGKRGVGGFERSLPLVGMTGEGSGLGWG